MDNWGTLQSVCFVTFVVLLFVNNMWINWLHCPWGGSALFFYFMQRRFANYGVSVPWHIFLFTFSIKPLSHCFNFYLILLIFLLLFCYRNVLHLRPHYHTFRPAVNSPLHLDFQLRYNHVSRINRIYAYKRVTVHYITQRWSKYSSVKKITKTQGDWQTLTCLRDLKFQEQYSYRPI